jgi:diaminopimelate epimerase
MHQFAKYHGLGNDFILIDGLSTRATVSAQDAIRHCDRHFGIGADGVILALPSAIADCRMYLLNSDGSEAEMCGNGLRCLTQFVWDEKLIRKTEMTIETLAGLKRPHLRVDGERVVEITVEMGKPLLLARQVPTTLVAPEAKAIDVPLAVDGVSCNVTALNTGVPQCVIFVPDAEGIDWRALGPRIAHHPAFPQGANAMFTQILARDHLRVRPWERGAGATLACGTGACAAVVAAALTDRAERDVRVTLPGGTLQIRWDSTNDEVMMTGPAERVFVGELGERLAAPSSYGA